MAKDVNPEIARLRAEVKELRAILAEAVSFDDAVTRDDPEPEDDAANDRAPWSGEPGYAP